MPKYEVKLVSEITKVAFVEVEARDEDEVYDKAYDYKEEDLEWDYTYTAYYADDVEELKSVVNKIIKESNYQGSCANK